MPVGAHMRITQSGAEVVARGFAGIGKQVQGLEQRSSRAARVLTADMGKIGGAMRGLYVVMGGVGIVAGAKKVLDFRSALGQLQADMGASTGEAQRLMDKVLGISTAHNVSKESVMEALQVFQDYGGIVRQGSTILDGLGKVSKASGTNMAELATIASTLMQTLGMTPEQALNSITQMNQQAKLGQIAMRNLARIIPEVMGAGVGKGFGGQRAITQLGTLLQVAGQAVGGKPEEARTQALALMRDLKAKGKDLKKSLKIDVLDKDKNLKDIDELMKAVLTKTKGTMMIGGKDIFTEESAKVAGIFRSMFDVKTGQWKQGSTLTNVLGAKGGMGTVEEQYRLRMEGVAKEAEQVSGGLMKLEEALQKYGGAAIGAIAESPGKALALAGGGYLGLKLAPMLAKGLGGLLTGKGKLGGLAGAAGAAGALPVYVVNLPGANVWEMIGMQGKGAIPGAAGTAGKGILGAALGSVALPFAVGMGAGAFDADTKARIVQGALERVSKAKVGVHASASNQMRLMEQARMYASMAAGGMTSVGLGGGKRADLTQDFVTQRLTDQAKALGLKELPAAIKELISAIRSNPQTVAVKPAGGLDRVEVKAGRGQRQ